MLACLHATLETLLPRTVHVMTRHGTRSPTRTYKGDDSYWDCESNYQVTFSQIGKPLSNRKLLNIIFDVKKLNQGNCGKG